MKKPPLLAISIPAAGAQVGLSRNGSYDAARRGEIPYLEFGKLKKVPVKLWEQVLAGEVKLPRKEGDA